MDVLPMKKTFHLPWYMEIEKASAIQNPNRLGHPQVRSGEPTGMGSKSLLDSRLPSVPSWAFSDRSCSRSRDRGLIVSVDRGRVLGR